MKQETVQPVDIGRNCKISALKPRIKLYLTFAGNKRGSFLDIQHEVIFAERFKTIYREDVHRKRTMRIVHIEAIVYDIFRVEVLQKRRSGGCKLIPVLLIDAIIGNGGYMIGKIFGRS